MQKVGEKLAKKWELFPSWHWIDGPIFEDKKVREKNEGNSFNYFGPNFLKHPKFAPKNKKCAHLGNKTDLKKGFI